MRLARKLPPVRPLSGLVIHLCGRCGYVGASEREPEPPPPKWLQPKRGSRYSCFVPALGSANDLRAARSCLDQPLTTHKLSCPIVAH